MEEACKAVEDRITGIGGAFNFHMKPKVVTATDEADLAKQLERAEQENAEVCLFLPGPLRYIIKTEQNYCVLIFHFCPLFEIGWRR